MYSYLTLRVICSSPTFATYFNSVIVKYNHLFFDLDHTLWDFDTNAKYSLLELYENLSLRDRGVDDFEIFYRNYLKHNAVLWERYRKGFIKQADLRVKRMRLTLLDFKIGDEKLAETMGKEFLEILPTRDGLFPYSIEILEYLTSKNYRLHLITNGFEDVQHKKLTHSRIKKYFEEVITSEVSNSLKPHKDIFEYALKAAGAGKEESIMLGDDLEADIIGAYKAGLDQVFINHNGKKPDFRPTYTVHSLKELEEIF